MAQQTPYRAEQIEKIIRTYLTREFLYDRPQVVLTGDLDIIDQEILDSLSILRLITFLEERFSLKIDPEEILFDNFRTVRALTSLVAAKLRPLQNHS